MNTRLGVPKPPIEQVGVLDEVELLGRSRRIVIAPVRPPRDGWASAAAALAGDAPKLVETAPTHFDETEWTW